MNKLFGTSKPKPAPEPAVNINAPTLGETSQKMDQRTKVIQTKIDDCNTQLADLKRQMASARGTGLNSLKQRALQVLRRRKMYDQQLGSVMNQQFNVDQVAFATESMQDTMNTVSALKEANTTQQAMMKEFNMDQMEDLFDDMADMMADMEEINECMGRAYNVEFDEGELMGELDELDEELAMEQLDAGLGMPSYVPNSQKEAGAAQAQPAQANESDALNNMMQI